MAESDPGTGTEEVSSDASTEKGLADSIDAEIPAARRRKRWLVGSASVVLAAAIAGVVFAVVPSGDDGREGPPGAVGVTYAVTGTGPVTITYNDGGASAQRVADVELPWTWKARVMPGKGTPRVSIILGKDGGKAACSVAVRGTHRQTSSAFGSYGRATCSAKVSPTSP
jgi:hypothetical protein